jgi:hypothetical protein
LISPRCQENQPARLTLANAAGADGLASGVVDDFVASAVVADLAEHAIVKSSGKC